MRLIAPLFFLALAILGLDQLSKAWIVSQFSLTDSWVLVENLVGFNLSIVHTTNTGAAWSLLQEYPGILFVARLVLLVVLITYLIRTQLKLNEQIALTMIIAGALGNVFDTLIYGHVIDMISCSFRGSYFPVFNLADSSISLGACYLLWEQFRGIKSVTNTA